MSIERRQLMQRLGSRPVALLEAPGGYGKSRACLDFARHVERPALSVVVPAGLGVGGVVAALATRCRRSGLTTVAQALDPEDPAASLDHLLAWLRTSGSDAVLVIDELQRSPDAGPWLAALAQDVPEDAHLLVAGRRLGPVLAALRGDPRVEALDADDLRFTPSEVGEVLEQAHGVAPTPSTVEEMAALTGGWPAAVVMAASHYSPDQRAPRPQRGAAILQGLVDALLATADPATVDLTRAAAHLPLLSAQVLGAIGGDGALDALLDAGLPIHFRPDGWGELADPVRDALTGPPPPTHALRAVAGLYAAGGEIAEALVLLQRAGDGEGLAALLGSQDRFALAGAGLPLVEVAVTHIDDDALRTEPAAVVNLVRAAEHHPRLRETWLQRAAAVLPPDTPARRAADAEAALDTARAGDLAGAMAAAERVLASTEPSEAATAGRAHQVRALCYLLRDVDDTADVVDALERAAALFRVAGETAWEAYAHQALGYGVHFTAGALNLAADRLDQALALHPSPNTTRADTLTYVAEVMTHLGRLDDAATALREAEEIGRRTGDKRVVGYAAWSHAELACQRRDVTDALAAIARAESNGEGWFDGLAGVDFLSHAAEILAVLGEEHTARIYLARAQDRAAGTGREDVPVATEARIEAVYGDPARAVALLDRLDTSKLMYRRDRWLRLLLRAVCASRLGSPAAAQDHLEAAYRAAEAMDDPQRAQRREPELLRIVAPDAAAVVTAVTSVSVLGGFNVARGPDDITPRAGRPALLVKLLAVRGTATADEVIDVLWSEVSLETGRSRLRNVLSRIRTTSGPIIARGEGTVALADDVEVDARRFEQEARTALAAPHTSRGGLARRALHRYTGDLLPADVYVDWTAGPRERLRRLHLDVLDLIVDEAIGQGDLEEASHLLATGIGLEPGDEHRYVRLAQILVTLGRPHRARLVVEQGVQVARDLGGGPAGHELQALHERLWRR